ncbi:sodium:proton symporter [Thermococcus siculi]|uniref:Sodium:proton symporter n=1 Tax=Thermococcus siculi TaxID=72803 RepID=A0A2Z2MN00_9EURY|nr:arsenic resistance protein [Thermococcus siculi]ASJ09752.1 sodium:proton symporter [Thermococcus siculi]
MVEMDVVEFMKEKMVYIVFTLIFASTYAGVYHRDLFLSLKGTLPVALFMMLFQPMVFMEVKRAFTARTEVKTKYLILLTLFYLALFPALTWLLLKFWLAVMPGTDPRLLAGIVLISLSPLPSSAPAFTNLAGGRFQLTLVGVIWTFLLSLFVMPVYAKLILHAVIQVPVDVLLKSLVLYIITPLIIGQLTKYAVLRWKGVDALMFLKKPLVGVSLLGMYWMVVVVFGINGKVIVERPELILVGAIIMNVYFLLRAAIAYFSGKALSFPFEQNVSLVYSTGSNMTLATAIAIGTFGSLAAVGTALGGPFSDMLLMILFVRFFNLLKKRIYVETNIPAGEET